MTQLSLGAHSLSDLGGQNLKLGDRRKSTGTLVDGDGENLVVMTHPMVFRSELMRSHYSEIGLLAIVVDRSIEGTIIPVGVRG